MTDQDELHYGAKWIAPGVSVLECNICGAWVEPSKSEKHNAFHESMRLSPCLADWLNLFRSMGCETPCPKCNCYHNRGECQVGVVHGS